MVNLSMSNLSNLIIPKTLDDEDLQPSTSPEREAKPSVLPPSRETISKETLLAGEKLPVTPESWFTKMINSVKNGASSFIHAISLSRIYSERQERIQNKRIDLAEKVLMQFGQVESYGDLKGINIGDATDKVVSDEERFFLLKMKKLLDLAKKTPETENSKKIKYFISEDEKTLKHLEKKYFGTDQEFKQRFQAKQNLDNLWPEDKQFTSYKYGMLTTPETRKYIPLLEKFSKREEFWGYIKGANDLLFEQTAHYRTEESGHILKSTKYINDLNGSDHNLLYLLANKGIITKQDYTLLQKFYANTEHINLDGRNRLMELNNEVLSPLLLIFDEERFGALHKIATPSEQKLMDRLDKKLHNDLEQITQKDISELKGLCKKYYGKNKLFERKKEAFRIHNKLYHNPEKISEKEHKRLESTSRQHELQEVEEFVDKEGLWKELDWIIKTFESQGIGIHQKFTGNFLQLLQYEGILSKKEYELLEEFKDGNFDELVQGFDDEKKRRDRLAYLLTDLLRPLGVTLLSRKTDKPSELQKDALKKITGWFTNNELTKIRAIFKTSQVRKSKPGDTDRRASFEKLPSVLLTKLSLPEDEEKELEKHDEIPPYMNPAILPPSLVTLHTSSLNPVIPPIGMFPPPFSQFVSEDDSSVSADELGKDVHSKLPPLPATPPPLTIPPPPPLTIPPPPRPADSGHVVQGGFLSEIQGFNQSKLKKKDPTDGKKGGPENTDSSFSGNPKNLIDILTSALNSRRVHLDESNHEDEENNDDW